MMQCHETYQNIHFHVAVIWIKLVLYSSLFATIHHVVFRSVITRAKVHKLHAAWRLSSLQTPRHQTCNLCFHRGVYKQPGFTGIHIIIHSVNSETLITRSSYRADALVHYCTSNIFLIDQFNQVMVNSTTKVNYNVE
jgi:hypothetical protein